jgi:hypothetical protein
LVEADVDVRLRDLPQIEVRAGLLMLQQIAAKDIFRASGLPALDSTNSHVRKNISKIRGAEKMVPILLARDTRLGKVVIADGYHRMCAVHYLDEDAMIPCKIV